jgi:uncharacterized protein HemY
MRRVLELRSDPEHSADAKRFLALTALEQNGKDIAAPQAEIQKYLKDNPNYVPALMVRASIEMRRGESKTALDIYIEILRRFPDFAPAQKQLATLYLENPATFDRAYDLAMKARKTLPDDPEVARTLGELCYQRKDYAYALQLLRESAKRKSLDAKALYYLGMSYLTAQEERQSQDALKRSLAAGLQEPLASEAKRVLAGLDKR